MMAWMEHPNATRYRRTADAFRAGDREALADLIDEDVVWHIPGSGPMSGDIHGREALFHLFDRLRDVRVAQALRDPYVAAYIYVNNRPTIAVDPSRLWCLIHNSSGGCLGSGVVHSEGVAKTPDELAS